MGNWRNRPPRRFYREKLPPPISPPRPHELENDNVPSWEKRFCAVVGRVPWWKVVNAKKLMFCSSNVLNWNDSAGEEAFHNAKRRFWASTNRLHCDISLPDPDMYIDKINWNPSIDPKLIEELDQAYFAPDEEIKYGRQNKKAKQSSSDGYNRSQSASDNPWDCNNMLGSGTGIPDGNHHVDEFGVFNNNENPWETSCSQAVGTTQVTGWGESRDSSWGWNQEGNNANTNTSLSKIWDSEDNAWKHGSKDIGWRDRENNSCGGWNHWESKNSGNGDDPWTSRFIRNGGSPKNIGQRGRGGGSQSWNHCNNYTSELKSNSAGWEPWNEKKREYPVCRSRFQSDIYQSANYCGQGRAKKRVNFAP